MSSRKENQIVGNFESEAENEWNEVKREREKRVRPNRESK